MNDYQPISCAYHGRLEYAVLTRCKLDLAWQVPNEAEQCRVLLPQDVWTQDGAEWLKAADHRGKQYVIRLDWIGAFCDAK